MFQYYFDKEIFFNFASYSMRKKSNKGNRKKEIENKKMLQENL